MKYLFLPIILMLYSCTKNNVEGRVYDYDSSKPIQNVEIVINENRTQTDSTGYFCINVNSPEYVILVKKEGYADKKVFRKQNSSQSLEKKETKNIYLFKRDSDFTLKK